LSVVPVYVTLPVASRTVTVAPGSGLPVVSFVAHTMPRVGDSLLTTPMSVKLTSTFFLPPSANAPFWTSAEPSSR
jgi:hypothetical protein